MSELSSQAKAFLEAHRRDGEPTAADADRVAAALAKRLEPVPLPHEPARPRSGPLGVAKIGVAIVLGLSLLAWVARARAEREIKPALPPVAPASALAEEAPRMLPPTKEVVSPPIEVPKAAPRPVRAITTPTPRSAPVPPEPVLDVPAPPPVEERIQEALPPPPLPPADLEPVASPLEDELMLVSEAQDLVRGGQSARALEVLARWETHFGQSGQLGPEARATRIVALCASGQVERGRAEASAYFAAYATSPHRNRIERACALRGPQP